VERLEERARSGEPDQRERHGQREHGGPQQLFSDREVVVDAVGGDDESREVEQLEVLVGEELVREVPPHRGEERAQREEEEQPSPGRRLEHAASAAAGQIKERERQKNGAHGLDEGAQQGQIHDFGDQGMEFVGVGQPIIAR
jgi:hypothetical protein